jgi:acyl-CoA synthetase (AMP-forming)/AMP-acid ligase II
MMRVGPDAAPGELTVGTVARHFARLAPGKRALYDGERALTYGELDRQCEALACALVRMGVTSGDVVAAYLPNSIDYVVVVLAAARSGAIFCPVNPRYKRFELRGILAKAKPRVLFTTHAQADAVAALAAELGASSLALVVVDAEGDSARPSLAGLLHGPSGTLPAVAESDCFSLMFTSGTTTGEPKGVLATHRARMLWVVNAVIEYGLGEDDVYLGTMPQVHSAGLTFTLMHLYVGATVRILAHFDAAQFIAIVARERITSALTVPTMLTMIVEALEREPAAPSIASLRRLVTCGSPLPLATKQRVLERVTPELYDYYGSTESNSMTVLRPVDQLRKPGSVGQPFRNVELMIADDAGNACAAGVVGEVWCANPSAMSAYLDAPGDTARAFSGRWFHTGDLGYLDEDGFLNLVSRRDDVIISGGVNIYPAEIERVLMLHPSVLDAAVVGAPDAKWGQSVKAYVVVRQGESVDCEAIRRHCTDHLADFKKPRSIELVAALPKNAGGKTIKSALA